MTFGQSISTCFSKYATFSGRASRSEYWWWYLLTCIPSVIQNMTDNAAIVIYTSIFGLVIFIPSIAVHVRRMHDTGHSGWFLLIPIYNLILACTASDFGDNEYGSMPD